MQYTMLGTTGLQVSRVTLGTVALTPWGNPDPDACIEVIRTALDRGVNVIDTADMYAQGEAEKLVGRALRGRRDQVVLATKVGGQMGSDPNARGGSRRWIMRAVDASLRRLQTEWIDLYQLHRFDPTCDLEETLGALSDLVHAGKVRLIGTTCFRPEDIVDAQWLAHRRNLVRFATEQPPYSIFVREAERGVLPTCRRHRIGTFTHAPLNGGWLTGQYRRGQQPPRASRARRWPSRPERYDTTRPEVQHKLDAVEALVELAQETGHSLVELALGFVLGNEAVDSVAVGPRTTEQLHDLLDAAEVALDPEVRARLDDIVLPGCTLDTQDVLPFRRHLYGVLRDSTTDPPAVANGS